MVPLWFIWKVFRFVAVLTWAHKEQIQLSIFKILHQLSQNWLTCRDYPAVDWRNRPSYICYSEYLKMHNCTFSANETTSKSIIDLCPKVLLYKPQYHQTICLLWSPQAVSSHGPYQRRWEDSLNCYLLHRHKQQSLFPQNMQSHRVDPLVLQRKLQRTVVRGMWPFIPSYLLRSL